MESLVFKSTKGNPVTSSRLVAEKFDKRHSDVLRAINNLELSEDFRRRNFALVTISNLDNPSPIIKEEKHYVMTKDGFTFLVMGSTGATAGKFKEEYIDAFNKMEQQLKQLAPLSRLQLLEMALESEKKALALQPKAEFADKSDKPLPF